MSAKRKTPAMTAREYLRVSLDRSGRARSTGEQHDDNRRAADEQGWTLGTPYRDDNRSASRYARKAREDFGHLVGDLEHDRFDADVLLLWESSRGSRKVSEWVTLIELCEQRAVRIYVTTHGRLYDPGNARDRRSLLEDSVDSEYESAKISIRATRAAAADAAAGKPHGPTPYGYKRLYDPVTRRYAGQVQEPAEAAVIRELFDRIVKGHSLYSITADFREREIRSRSGKVFSSQYLRAFLCNPAYAGQRLHVPGRKHSNTATALTKEAGTLVDAQWEALVPRATFLQVQRIITSPERKTTRPGRAVHLLSMIARCGECGRPLAAGKLAPDDDRPTYRCHGRKQPGRVGPGCVQIDKAELDDLAEKAIVGYLARSDVYEALSAASADSDQLEAARAALAEIRAELDDLADRLGRGELSATLAARAEPSILARLKAAEDAEAALTAPPRLRGLITPGKDVARRWRRAEMSTKREVARILLAPDLLGELRVTRSPKPGRKVPVTDRVVWCRAE